MIFRRFPTTFRRFSKIFQNCPKDQTNVPEHFPKVSEDVRKLPNRKTRRCFDDTNELKYNLRDKPDVSVLQVLCF